MAQLFPKSANYLAKSSILVGLVLVGSLVTLVSATNLSSYVNQVEVVREQPVPFSHKHHVNGLGIDCRFCHSSVEQAAFAGIPPTKTCMGCHSQVWTEAPILEPVRESWRTDKSLPWLRVTDLPDYVYFNHSIHVAKGVGCATCHGRVDLMPLTFRQNSLNMMWCLECHRDPSKFVRPPAEVFNMAWTPPGDQAELGKELVSKNHIQSKMNCSTCHR